MEYRDAGLLMKQICESVERQANQDLKEYGVTLSQWRVLVYLYEKGLQSTQKALERFFAVSHPTMVGLLKRLEAKGLVRCEMDGKNRRQKNVYLTGKAVPIFEKMNVFHVALERRMFAGMGLEERERGLDYLNRLYRNICEAM